MGFWKVRDKMWQYTMGFWKVRDKMWQYTKLSLSLSLNSPANAKGNIKVSHSKKDKIKK